MLGDHALGDLEGVLVRDRGLRLREHLGRGDGVGTPVQQGQRGGVSECLGEFDLLGPQRARGAAEHEVDFAVHDGVGDLGGRPSLAEGPGAQRERLVGSAAELDHQHAHCPVHLIVGLPGVVEPGGDAFVGGGGVVEGRQHAGRGIGGDDRRGQVLRFQPALGIAVQVEVPITTVELPRGME
ncbi:hypothetical protein ACFV2Q_18975 [Streptomyces sp. NPDC059650]|uniref:hypothetical protein n=1 Tax=Streptomyces sp. NPDC059650 TaxID=3346896 RepID=UPI0036C18BF8